MVWNQQVKGVPNDLFDSKPGQLHPGQLIEFGQVGYVTIRKQIKTKWEDKSTKCIMVGYADDHSGDTYRMYDPTTNHVRLTQDVCWAAWTRTDPTEAMKVFEQTTGTKPTTMAGASMDNDLSTTTILLNADEDVLHDKVGRIETLTTNANTTPNVTNNNAVQRTIPTRSTVRTGTAPAPARHVQFHNTDIQQLMLKLRALQFRTHETETTPPAAVETNKPTELVESVNLAFNHATELLCFTMEISSDPGLPKMLREVLSRRDAEKWKEALASKILNFLKCDAWRTVPMSQVL